MRRLILCVTALIPLACSTHSQIDRLDGTSAITPLGLETHIAALASDEFLGRKPFTAGENKTIDYLQKQFTTLGLEAGNEDSFLQEVPMVEITPTTDTVMVVAGGKEEIKLRGFHDFTLGTERTDSSVTWKETDIVFAGFGIVAPEYGWNDYEGLDVTDKIVLVLVNDPGFGGSDTTFFKGNTMTYYGRWTYKYEEAARQGARGCFVIHNTVPAGYPFAVLQNTWNSAHLYLDERGKDVRHCQGIGWITKAATEKLFAAAGHDFNDHQTRARSKGYRGMPLNLKASVGMSVKSRYDKSYNVVARITGSERPDEYVIYSAHWDHLGIGKADGQGDSIYNGAYDNASGTSGLIELARAFSSMNVKPRRTVIFLAVTAEEQGLWGSAYYAQNPIYPKEKTVANINIDGLNPYGKMRDVMVVGKGQSELEDYLREEAASEGRIVRPDNEPEKGLYFRSDHFWFAKIGIPALYIKTGDDFEGKGIAYGQQLKTTYTQKHYHQPSDEYDPSRMNFDGAATDLRLLFLVGKRVAMDDAWPQWKKGSEFKAVRDEYLKTAAE